MQTLTDIMRQEIKDGLDILEEKHHKLFKQMYSHENQELPIHEVVDNMDESKLERAYSQVLKTLGH